MFAVLLLLALGQSPTPPTIDKVIADADLRVEAAPLPPVGATIALPAGCPVAARPEHLRALVLVAALARADEELAGGRFANLVAAGQVLEVPEAARLRVTRLAPDAVLKDRAGRPAVAVAGTVADGKYAGRTVYLLPGQLQGAKAVRTRDQAATPWAVPPAFGDAEGAAAYEAGRPRRAEVYGRAKAARGRARAEASFRPAASRAAATERMVAAATRVVAESEKISDDALATIIAEGEDADGSADKRARKAAAYRAKASNDLLGMQIDAALAPGLARAARAASHPLLGHPGERHSFSLPWALPTLVPGNQATNTPAHYDMGVRINTTPH